MKSSETSKRSSDIELTDRGEQSDEETLLAIKKRNTRKRSKPSTQDTATEISNHETTEQENSVHDDELNMMQIDEGSGGLEAVDSAALRETDSLKDKLNDSIEMGKSLKPFEIVHLYALQVEIRAGIMSSNLS